MTFENAWQRVTVAGRELGGGPSLSVKRIVPHYQRTMDWMLIRNVPTANASGIMMGVAVGLVMSEDPQAMLTLEAIEHEWREEEGHGDDDTR